MSSRTVIVLIEGPADSYDESNHKFTSGDDQVIVTEVGDNGNYIRGYNADTVIAVADVSEEVRRQVIDPMLAVGDGEFIDL